MPQHDLFSLRTVETVLLLEVRIVVAAIAVVAREALAAIESAVLVRGRIVVPKTAILPESLRITEVSSHGALLEAIVGGVAGIIPAFSSIPGAGARAFWVVWAITKARARTTK